MERVAFLVESTGERISCLLNPEYLQTRRSAGLRTRADAGGFLSANARSDYPLLATGGGVTEIEMRLLFDVAIARADTAQVSTSRQPEATSAFSAPSEDIRESTRRFWNLAENSTKDGVAAPPVVRFIWGKSWNVPGVVTAVAERLEQFDANGTPKRSWLSLRLRRVEQVEPRPAPPMPVTPQFEFPAAEAQPQVGDFPGVEMQVDQFGAPLNRLDLLAAQQYGSSAAARDLAAFNGLDDLISMPPGTTLSLPPLSQLWRRG